MKEYAHIFSDDAQWGPRAKRVSGKTKDITEFLIETGFWPATAELQDHGKSAGAVVSGIKGKRVSYHDACHLVHTQKISAQPRELLKMVPGIEYVELPEASWCCGSAGIYNIVRYDDSMKMLDRKVDNIQAIHPDVIVTGNPGCMLQIQHGLKEKGMNVELMHTATFLWRACDVS
jgi:glycolate oxidase iron-sulfur subunit